MDPELKAYLDAWQDREQRAFDAYMALIDDHKARMDALPQPATDLCASDHDNSTPVVDTTGGVVVPVQASAGVAEFVTASVGLVEPPATAPIGEESLAVARAVPIVISAMVPPSCSMNCPAQVVTASTTTTLLLWASSSSSSPDTSVANGMVSTELAPDIDDVEHGASLDDGTVVVVPVLAAAAASDESLDGEPVKGAASTAPTLATERSLAVTMVVPDDTIVVVHAFSSADRVTQVITVLSATPTTPAPLVRCSSFLTNTTSSCRCYGPLLRPTPWPSFLGVQLNVPENRSRLWPSFACSCGQQQSRLPPKTRYSSVVQGSSDWLAMTTAARLYSPNYECLLHGNAPNLPVNDFSEDDTLGVPFHHKIVLSMREHELSTILLSYHVELKISWECSEIATHLNSRSSVRPTSAGQVHHMKLQPKEAEMDQFIAQPEKYVSFCLQPKPPWLSSLTKFGTKVEHGGAYLHEDVMTLNSETNLIVLGLRVRQQISGYLLWTQSQAEWYTSCNQLLLNCKPTESTYVLLIDHHSWLSSLILGVSVTWPNFLLVQPTELFSVNITFQPDYLLSMDRLFLQRFRPPELYPILEGMKNNNSMRSSRTLNLPVLEVNGVIGSKLWSQFGIVLMVIWSSQFLTLFNGGEQCSNCPELSLALRPVWQHVKGTQWSWDPRGCTLALCSLGKKWTTTLNCYAQIQWLSLQVTGAFWIWLVAWILDVLVFSMCPRQAPCQGGRNVLRADFFDDVRVNHDYYIAFINQIPAAFINQIPAGYNYYLAQRYFDTNIIYYHEDYHCASSKTKEVHMPWDPGGSSWCDWFSPCDTQGKFQGGRAMPALDQHKEHRLPWDPGAPAASGQLKRRRQQWIQPGSQRRRLGVKPSLKKGGMLGTYSTATGLASWAATRARPDTDLSYIYVDGDNAQAIQRDHGTERRHFSSHLGSVLPSPFMLCLSISYQFMYL
jgi:hypothetical protein